MNFFARVFDQMARMGLAFKADPIHVIETKGRVFGEVTGGLDLSIAAGAGKDLITVILRNTDSVPKTIATGGWLHFLHPQVVSPSGVAVPLSPYGREALEPGRAKKETVGATGTR